jgi:hypothetical protein
MSELPDVTLPELLAFYFKKHGKDRFNEMLSEIHQRMPTLFRGFHKTIIEELRSVGLASAASILEAWDETLLHQWQLECRIPRDCTNLRKEWDKEMAAKKLEWEQSLN